MSMLHPRSVSAAPRPGRSPGDRLIVALDYPELAAARDLVRRLRPAVRWFKIGSELFTAAGPASVAMVREEGARVFLDLKFHDIPNTVAGAVAAAARLGVAMLNVHTSGGAEMMRAAVEAAESGADDRPVLIGVTTLTSDPADPHSIARIVDQARSARGCGLDGVVASPQEAAAIKATCGSGFIVVTPGIRLSTVPDDDQRRTATPTAAVQAGADYLVVGRPITRAADPVEAAGAVLRGIEQAL